MKKQRTSSGGGGSSKKAVAVADAPLAYVPFERTPNGGVPCPWCKKECDAGFRCPVIAKPCLHVGCMDCVRRAVAPVAMNSHKHAMCPVCSKIVRTFTIEGAPVSRVVAEKKPTEEKTVAATPSNKGKEEEEEGDEAGGVMVMELNELKQLRGTEPDEAWVCIVCAFNYDNATRMPVCVSACYAIAADPHMPNLDRGLAPGCGHNICEQCMLELFAKGDPTCYTCRAYIKDFGINVPLLRKIAAFKGGYYLSLVLQLNDSAKKQHEMTMAARKREEEFKRFDELKAKVTRLEKERDTAVTAQQTAERGLSTYLSKYNAAHARANTLDQQCAKATERLRAAMGINKMLYDEVIALRLQAMEAGLIPRSQLGLKYDAEQSVGKVVLKVLSRDCKTTMYYGRRWKELSSEERGAIDRIRAHNKREREGEAGELACLPTDDEIEQSHKAMASGQPLVRVGSWLHERIMSKVNTVEATFDAPFDGGGGGMVEEMAMYCAVSREALAMAMSAYERMSKEARNRPPPTVDVDLSAPDVTVGKGREMCPNCQLLFACGQDDINCTHLAAVEEDDSPPRRINAREADYCFVGARDGVDRISAGPLMPPFRPLETGEVLPMPEWIEALRRHTAPVQQQQQQAAREVSDFATDFLPSHAAAASPEEMLRAVAARRAQIAREGGGGPPVGASRNDGVSPVAMSTLGLRVSLLGVEAARQRIVSQRIGAAIRQWERADDDDARVEETNNNDADRAPESMFDL